MQRERLQGRIIISEKLKIESVEYNTDDFVQAGRKNKYTKRMVAWATSSESDDTGDRFPLEPCEIQDADLSTDIVGTLSVSKKRKVVSNVNIESLESIDANNLTTNARFILHELVKNENTLDISKFVGILSSFSRPNIKTIFQEEFKLHISNHVFEYKDIMCLAQGILTHISS